MAITADEDLYGKGRQYRSGESFYVRTTGNEEAGVVEFVEYDECEMAKPFTPSPMPKLTVTSDGFLCHATDPLWVPSREELARVQAALDFLAGQTPDDEARAPQRGHPRFYELLRAMERIHDAKNSDYADSASDPLRNFRACEAAGISAFDGCLARISDKYMRVMNLAKKEREGREQGVKSEAITDTLLDLANYSLIALILYEEAK